MGLITFAGGVQAQIQSDLEEEGASAGSFQIRGSEGMLEATEHRVRLFNAGSGGWKDMDVEEGGERRSIGGETNAAQVRELIAWIEGGPEHRGSGRKARATVEIMMAMFESARKHRAIRMPLEEKGYPLDLMIEEGLLPVEVEGRYDIRGFLKWDGVDEADYARLRAEGAGHAGALKRLREGKAG